MNIIQHLVSEAKSFSSCEPELNEEQIHEKLTDFLVGASIALKAVDNPNWELVHTLALVLLDGVDVDRVLPEILKLQAKATLGPRD